MEFDKNKIKLKIAISKIKEENDIVMENKTKNIFKTVATAIIGILLSTGVAFAGSKVVEKVWKTPEKIQLSSGDNEELTKIIEESKKENITEENVPEIIEESKEEIKEEVKEENKNGNLEKEIDNIGSIKDIQEWLKEVYVKKHEEISEKPNNDLMPDAINIVNTRVAGMYKTFDGEYVTTVNKKEVAENILDEKGISYESVFSSKVYMAINEDDGTIIDCANKINDEYHKVLVAENYEKMSSDEKSVLVGMGGITPAAFYLMNLYNQQEEYQEENNKSSEFLELKIEDAKKILKSK